VKPVTLYLRFGAFTLALAAQDERLLARAGSYYRPFVRSDANPLAVAQLRVFDEAPSDDGLPFSPWDGRGKESFAELPRRRVVRKDRTGVQIVVNARRWTIAGDLHRNFPQLLNVITTMYGLWLLDRGSAMLHASAVVHDGRAIAFVGQSGTGKSSVAVRLLERRFDFLSNDRLIVEAKRGSVTAHGLPKLPRVNPGTLLASRRTRSLVDGASRRRYQRLPSTELWSLEEKRDLDVQGALGRRWLLSAPLACALVLAWRAGDSGLAMERLHPDQALTALRDASKTFGPFDTRLRARSDGALQALAGAVPVYRVSGAIDPTRLAREIASGRAVALP
jgi:HprK-related kinase B